jgi:hypothetical protein
MVETPAEIVTGQDATRHDTARLQVRSVDTCASRAIAQAVSRRLTTVPASFRSRSSHVGFVVDKWHWGWFSPSTSVFPANSHSTECSIFIHHPELVQ